MRIITEVLCQDLGCPAYDFMKPETKICKHCGVEIFYKLGEWYHKRKHGYNMLCQHAIAEPKEEDREKMKKLRFFMLESWRVNQPIIDLGFFKLYGSVDFEGLGFWKSLYCFLFPFLIVKEV